MKPDKAAVYGGALTRTSARVCHFSLVVATVLTAGCSSTVPVQNQPVPAISQLAPGLKHEVRTDPKGPWKSHIVEIDLTNPGLSLDVVRAHDALKGRERTSSMAKRSNTDTSRVRVAVNADFFDLANGENENNQVIHGEWWKGLPLTDSPYDTYNNVHGQVAIDSTGKLTFGRFILDARAWVSTDTGTITVPVLSINSKPVGRYEGTAVYTPRFGINAPTGDTSKVAELSLRYVGSNADTLVYVVSAPAASRSGSTIPSNGVLLAGYGARQTAIVEMSKRDTVRLFLSTWPRLAQNKQPRTLVGGWPLIIQDGVNIAARAATLEGTISRNAEVRHPRTAIALSRSGKTVWLVTVDGRSESSVGMTLVELAEYLRTLGAWQALNFDGGGSTTMVIDGQVMNSPTDATGEREVGNALIVRQRKKPKR